MSSYDVLGVSEFASDKEIEIAYQDLKRKYEPSFNTSIYAYKKYREILKAYEDIKDEQRRKMYALKDDDKEVVFKEKKWELYDFDDVNEEIVDEKIDYNKVEKYIVSDYKDIEVNVKVSYLYKLLNLRYDLHYFHNVKCKECKEFKTCPSCDGEKVVEYKEKMIWCPVCGGEGKVSFNCKICGDTGYHKEENKLSIYVENDEYEFKGLGDEYSNNLKSNLKVNFDFFDIDNIKVNGDVIEVDYYLAREETLKGVNKEYLGEFGAFKLNVGSFVDNGYKKEINFYGKKIIFTFYNESYSGEDIVKYLFINKSFKGKYIYFNDDYSSCSKEENVLYPLMVRCDEKIVIKGKGNKGKYSGLDGDLVINVEFNNDDELLYTEKIKVLETSKIFNLLGGVVDGVRHYGFKRVNALIKRGDFYYLLRGNKKEKSKLKNYFIFKLLSLALWLLIPLLVILIPYSQTMFIWLVSVFVFYFILINVLMEVEV